MAEKNAAWERINEDFAPAFPDENIKCKDCAFKLPPIGKYDRYTNGYCKVYTPEISKGKPNDVLFKNGDCKYYHKEEPDD
jgi:hypothetical protein